MENDAIEILIRENELQLEHNRYEPDRDLQMKLDEFFRSRLVELQLKKLMK